jgi:hypothetical protein
MNGTISLTTDRQLLAEVSRWARANNWSPAEWRGFKNAAFEDQATIAVRVNEAGFQVWRKTSAAPRFTGQPTDYPASSVRQAVDFLVALRILPVKFSSVYEAGVRAGRLFADTDRIAATRPTNPDRRCRTCGATSGLILLPGNPLTGAGRAHECVDGCKSVTR